MRVMDTGPASEKMARAKANTFSEERNASPAGRTVLLASAA